MTEDVAQIELAGRTSREKVSGLLHDIRPQVRKTQNRHLIDGYRYLTGAGCPEIARVCITCALPLQDPHALSGSWEQATEADRQFVEDYVRHCEFGEDEFDRLLQLCDHLSTAC